MKMTDYPKQSAELQFEQLVAIAADAGQRFIVVQVSERKYQIGERRFVGVADDAVVPFVKLLPERYSWLKALDECAKRLRRCQHRLTKEGDTCVHGFAFGTTCEKCPSVCSKCWDIYSDARSFCRRPKDR